MWGRVKGLSPPPSFSWTKPLFVLGVSSWFAAFRGAARGRAARSGHMAPSTSSISELPMASCRDGKVASSWLLCHRDKMQYSGSPAAGTEKWLFCHWQKLVHMKMCANFKNLTAWKQGRQETWKQQEARYRRIKRKMLFCFHFPDIFENCSYQIEIRTR